MQERILGKDLKVSAVGLGWHGIFPCLWDADRKERSGLPDTAGSGDGIYLF